MLIIFEDPQIITGCLKILNELNSSRYIYSKFPDEFQIEIINWSNNNLKPLHFKKSKFEDLNIEAFKIINE